MKDKQVKSKKVKVFSIICTVLAIAIVLLAAGIIVNVIVSKAKNKPVSIFGYSFSIVATESMYPEIEPGDLIIFRKCSYNDIKVGDNIVFFADAEIANATDSEFILGQTIVHKVQEVTSYGLVTKGVKNQNADEGYREEAEILGICRFNSAFLGKVFKFLSKYGIIIIILVVAIPFIAIQIFKIVRFSKQKREEKIVANSTTDTEQSDNNDNNKTADDERGKE